MTYVIQYPAALVRPATEGGTWKLFWANFADPWVEGASTIDAMCLGAEDLFDRVSKMLMNGPELPKPYSLRTAALWADARFAERCEGVVMIGLQRWPEPATIPVAPAPRPVPEPDVAGLTESERAVLEGMRLGLDNPEIAKAQGLSLAAVHRRAANIYAKLGLGGRLDVLARWPAGEPFPRHAVALLDPREREIAHMLRSAVPHKQAAHELGMTLSAYSQVAARMMRTLGVANRMEFMARWPLTN